MILDSTPIRSSKGRRRLSTVFRGTGEIISTEEVAKLLRTTRADASKILARWVKQGWLARIRRGIYAQIPLETSQSTVVLTNPWVLIPTLFSPGYVGGWSAAEHWDFTEQIFQSVCVLTTKELRRRKHEVELTTFVAIRIPQRAFFGHKAIWLDGTKIRVSDPHKTIVDMLSNPAIGGGIRHVYSCLRSYFQSKKSSPSTLVSYGERLGNGAVFKRLGFLAATLRPDDQTLLDDCTQRLTRGLAQLDPAQPGARIASRWRLRIPQGWKP